ncbi:hypothetical protein GGC47_004910 [Bosea sp. OAE752]|uniref:DUF982 domain-containing protein n=1 Tax=Bosea sp. OAE752 TaxID=2663873 RepID=UPI003D1E00E3
MRRVAERIHNADVLEFMPLHWFSPPVYVATSNPGERYAVSNVERAAEYLLSWRHSGAGESWREAVAVCMAALKGGASVADARSTFEAAARECGRLV